MPVPPAQLVPEDYPTGPCPKASPTQEGGRTRGVHLWHRPIAFITCRTCGQRFEVWAAEEIARLRSRPSATGH